jgi:hypothetical protein
MFGNDRMRFCGQCKLNVYNLSGMSREEAENLVMNAEGRLCVRFYRRLDGTIITENCPVGWARVKARAKVYVTATFSLLMTFFGGIYLVSLFSRKPSQQVMGTIAVRPTPTPIPVQITMGAVANARTVPKVGELDPQWEIGKAAIPKNAAPNNYTR